MGGKAQERSRMTRLLFLIILLSPTPTHSNQVSIPEAIKAAYEMGKKDAFDDIGLKRLTIKDVEELI